MQLNMDVCIFIYKFVHEVIIQSLSSSFHGFSQYIIKVMNFVEAKENAQLFLQFQFLFTV